MKLYQAFARQWVRAQSKNPDISDNAEEEIKKLLALLPHGSGINGKYSDELEFISNSKSNKLVIRCSFQVMNPEGYYTRWIYYEINITPCLADGFDMRLKGNFSPDMDIKDYLDEMYYSVFDSEVV